MNYQATYRRHRLSGLPAIAMIVATFTLAIALSPALFVLHVALRVAGRRGFVTHYGAPGDYQIEITSAAFERVW